jgi:flagellar basal body P-ring formation protein FlgA
VKIVQVESYARRAHRLAAAGLMSLLALLAVRANVHAAERNEDHERIRSLAEAYARELAQQIAPANATIKAEAARLDPRLRLPACPVSPQTFRQVESFAGRTTVGVRCPAGPGWSLYVPVRTQIIADVVVLSAPLARGAVLSADTLRLDARDITSLSTGYLTTVADAEGMLLRRPVTIGTVLTPALLERPRLVRRGDRVRIRAADRIIAVTSEGEALADAAEGDRLKVRNTRSGLVIEGVVDAGGGLVAQW